MPAGRVTVVFVAMMPAKPHSPTTLTMSASWFGLRSGAILRSRGTGPPATERFSCAIVESSVTSGARSWRARNPVVFGLLMLTTT